MVSKTRKWPGDMMSMMTPVEPVKRKKPIASTRKRKVSGARKKKRAINPFKHEVKADLQNFELAKATASLKLQILANGQTVGLIEIGRGSLFWRGRGKHIKKRIDWGRFAAKMDELAYGFVRV